MLHCDDEDLALIALGESVDPVDEAHVRQCAHCQEVVAQFASVVVSARLVTGDDHPIMPPATVWQNITAELGLDTTATITPISAAPSRRASRTWLVAGAAAVAGVIVGGIVTAGISNQPTPQELVASTSLDPVDDSGFVGTAAVEERPDGAFLTVSVPDLPSVDDGYYEVWMASPDTTTMVAIGTLSPGVEASFPLPAGMDVSAFPVVDVSVEHFDGNTGHSAVSVVRGQLQA